LGRGTGGGVRNVLQCGGVTIAYSQTKSGARRYLRDTRHTYQTVLERKGGRGNKGGEEYSVKMGVQKSCKLKNLSSKTRHGGVHQEHGGGRGRKNLDPAS